MPKRYLGVDVLSAARERIEYTFDNFNKICVSFSGGKDSAVMLHLVMDEAIKRNRKVGVLFIDWECQMKMTIDFCEKMFELYADYIEPFWVSLPMKTWNATSQFEPEWTAWDKDKKDLWVRQPSKYSITEESFFPFYFSGMPFEEFVPAFAKWYSEGENCAQFVGIRADESLNRFRSIARDKPMFDSKPWTTNVVDSAWNVYPIYDWRTKDVWVYLGKYSKAYNPLYDLMMQAGMKLSQMRICEPFGDEARKGLWLYQVCEPDMWAKLALRVSGANTGALYAQEKGAVMGNYSVALPENHTYESFSRHLLESMPVKTSDHYKNKIFVYLTWWSKRGYEEGIPDKVDSKMESSGRVPSWRKVCKTILRNDFWCKGLGFSPTKSAAYEKYMKQKSEKRKESGVMA
jgi:predicted phosphoadenosine phosphosulfate sulfurtransferase